MKGQAPKLQKSEKCAGVEEERQTEEEDHEEEPEKHLSLIECIPLAELRL